MAVQGFHQIVPLLDHKVSLAFAMGMHKKHLEAEDFVGHLTNVGMPFQDYMLMVLVAAGRHRLNWGFACVVERVKHMRHYEHFGFGEHLKALVTEGHH